MSLFRSFLDLEFVFQSRKLYWALQGGRWRSQGGTRRLGVPTAGTRPRHQALECFVGFFDTVASSFSCRVGLASCRPQSLRFLFLRREVPEVC